MDVALIIAGIVGIITGITMLVDIRNVPLQRRKNGLKIFLGSLVVLIAGLMLYF